MPKRPRQIKDGDTIRIRIDPASDANIVREVCCGCSASHLVEYRVRGKYIFATTWLDPLYQNRRPAKAK